MNITEQEFRKVVAGATEANIQKYYEPLMAAMNEFDINTPERQVMFLAHIMVESGALRLVVENLNYSVTGLRSTFGKYYRTNTEAAAHAHQPVKIASRVYANRMGNGSEASQDGWKYRGRGLKQLTGKYNYTNCGNALGYDLVNNPEYLETPEGAARSAAWFWDNQKLNKLADAHDIKGSTLAINGGYNGLEERTKYYNRGMEVLRATYQNPDISTSIPSVILREGSKGKEVERLQGLLGIRIDADFGPATKKAVVEFQKSKGLIADGVVGSVTWKVLLNV